MKKEKLTIHGETPNVSQERALLIELYLQEHFEFRNNVLNGKVEYCCKDQAGDTYRPLTERAQNSCAKGWTMRVILKPSSGST